MSPTHAHDNHQMRHGLSYDLYSILFFRGRRGHTYRRLAEVSGAKCGDSVLDVGCGTGHLTHALAKVVATTGSVVGIDPSPQALSRAARRTHSQACTFRRGSAESLPVPDESFDVVVSSYVLHHIASDERTQALAEMFRVLRSGGTLLVAELLASHRSPSLGDHHGVVEQLQPLLLGAGFESLTNGQIRPRTCYLQGSKP